MIEDEIERARWMATVVETLAEHPDWAATTVQAMQAGLLEALDRELTKRETVSWGLKEALDTRPGAVKRDHGLVIAAIEASTFRGTAWAKKMTEKEQA